MANPQKLLEKMRTNPRDWTIEDIATVCKAYSVDFTPPRKGSHYKVKYSGIAQILTIPAHRPIKPVYIRELIKFIDAAQGAKS